MKVCRCKCQKRAVRTLKQNAALYYCTFISRFVQSYSIEIARLHFHDSTQFYKNQRFGLLLWRRRIVFHVQKKAPRFQEEFTLRPTEQRSNATYIRIQCANASAKSMSRDLTPETRMPSKAARRCAYRSGKPDHMT